MSLANFKEILTDAKKNNYAVPCLTVVNMETVIGQIMAAEEKKSPVILGYAPAVIPYIPSSVMMPFMIDAARHSSVPVAVQLDHGYEYNEILNSIKEGVSAVMFDGSDLEYEENVRRTSEFVKIAHSLGVAVEAELGCVGGGILETKKDSLMTDPDMAADFVTRTCVDALAVSFGNLHGKYKSEPKLDLERVKTISEMIETPLVMHGGSGLTEQDYRAVVAHGVSNIHFYSYLAAGVWPEIEAKTREKGKTPVYHDMIGWTIEYYYKEAIKVIDMLDSIGKASEISDCSIFSKIG